MEDRVTLKNLNREGMRKKVGISSSFNTVNLMGEFSVQKQVINKNKQKIDLYAR
jgi:hypothetical protein